MQQQLKSEESSGLDRVESCILTRWIWVSFTLSKIPTIMTFIEFLQSELKGLKLEKLVHGSPANNGVKSKALCPKAEEHEGLSTCLDFSLYYDEGRTIIWFWPMQDYDLRPLGGKNSQQLQYRNLARGFIDQNSINLTENVFASFCLLHQVK